jgi:hypothetical protein
MCSAVLGTPLGKYQHSRMCVSFWLLIEYIHKDRRRADSVSVFHDLTIMCGQDRFPSFWDLEEYWAPGNIATGLPNTFLQEYIFREAGSSKPLEQQFVFMQYILQWIQMYFTYDMNIHPQRSTSWFPRMVKRERVLLGVCTASEGSRGERWGVSTAEHAVCRTRRATQPLHGAFPPSGAKARSQHCCLTIRSHPTRRALTRRSALLLVNEILWSPCLGGKGRGGLC